MTRMVVVLRRNGSGQLCAWRVGRRRLAWRPRFPNLRGLEGAGGGPFEIIALAILLVVGVGHALNWFAALLATVVAWPYRAISGRWPVVAYPIDPSGVNMGDEGDDRPHRRHVQGRQSALALARQWALDIEQHGRPQATCAGEGSAPRNQDPAGS